MLLRAAAAPLLGIQHLDCVVESSIADQDALASSSAELRRDPKREFGHS